MKLSFLAALMASSIGLGAAAHAATYDFGTIGDDTTYTSNTINHPSGGQFSDFFTFNTTENLTEFTTAAFTEGAPFSITSADLTLFAGQVGSPTAELATSGNFDPMTQRTPTISAGLSPGDYFIQSDVSIPAGSSGSYTVTATTQVSAAPEPSTWLLMFAGIGGIGLMLRRAKKTMGFRFRDALAA